MGPLMLPTGGSVYNVPNDTDFRRVVGLPVVLDELIEAEAEA